MAYMKINVLKNRILFCKAIQKDIELAGKKNTIRTILNFLGCGLTGE
jgi:hypothetical protein